jgi:hypothetical protein
MKYCPHPNCMAQSRILLAFEADRKGGAAPRVDARAHSARTYIELELRTKPKTTIELKG